MCREHSLSHCSSNGRQDSDNGLCRQGKVRTREELQLTEFVIEGTVVDTNEFFIAVGGRCELGAIKLMEFWAVPYRLACTRVFVKRADLAMVATLFKGHGAIGFWEGEGTAGEKGKGEWDREMHSVYLKLLDGGFDGFVC